MASATLWTLAVAMVLFLWCSCDLRLFLGNKWVAVGFFFFALFALLAFLFRSRDTLFSAQFLWTCCVEAENPFCV